METDSSPMQSDREDLASSRGRAFDDSPIYARRPRFDGLTIGIHWATVLIVLALFAAAWLHALAEERHSDLTPFLLQIHRSLGVTVWVVTALRLAWRLTNASLPPFAPQMTPLHRAAVKLSEYALYALLLAQPVTGMLTTLFGGRPFALLVWQIPQLIPRHDMLRATFHFSHELGAWTLATLIAGHAGVAVFHHFVLRDDVLECMAPMIATARAKQELASGHIVPTRAGE
jgi:superoxide oxidase